MTLLKKMVLASALFCLGSVSAVMHEISSLEEAHAIALNDSFNYAGVEFKVLRLLSVLGVQLLELELLNSGLESVFLLPSECTGNIFYVSPSGELGFINCEDQFVPLAEKDAALAGASSDAHLTPLDDLSKASVAPVVGACEDLGDGAFRMRHPDRILHPDRMRHPDRILHPDRMCHPDRMRSLDPKRNPDGSSTDFLTVLVRRRLVSFGHSGFGKTANL